MKQILIVNGYKRSGKDTFVKILRDASPIPVYERGVVDRIKEIAHVFGWDGYKDPKGRKLLADLADVADRYNNFCYLDVITHIPAIYNDYIYCIHSRRPKDIQKFVEHYMGREDYEVDTIFIQRDEMIGKKESNTADSDVTEYLYDYYIDNNGSLKEFETTIKTFYKEVLSDE